MPRALLPFLPACILLLSACDGPQPAAPEASAASSLAAEMVPAVPANAAPALQARLPYIRIEAIVQAAAPGEIVEVELDQADHDDGDGSAAAIYEIKVLADSGRVLELEIDAMTGHILKQEIE